MTRYSTTIEPALAQLSIRLHEMLQINTDIQIDIPYPADSINIVFECMNKLLTAPVNVDNDYIFYQLLPIIEDVVNDIGIIEILELTYIVDYLEVEPLINVFAYMLSQYLLDPDIEIEVNQTKRSEISDKINQLLADIAYATDTDFIYNDLAPDVIKYINKHHFIAFARYYKQKMLAINHRSTEQIEPSRRDTIEYTVADLITVEPMSVELKSVSDGILISPYNKELTSLHGLFTIFNATNITVLDLGYNPIIDPYQDTHDVRSPFSRFTQVTELYLNMNSIERLPNTFFNGLISLTSLKMDNNLLIEMPVGISKLTRLQNLDLENNSLTNSIFSTLSTLTTLTSLVLSDNRLTKLTYENLKSFPKLDSLYVSYNRIDSIEPNIFANNTSLQDLSLRGNPVIGLTAAHFGYITSLISLILSHHSINSVEVIKLAKHRPNLDILVEAEDDEDE